MRVTIFGTGYVGLVTGVCFADLGNDVICVDIDEKKINDLNKGIMPIYEPGLKELCDRNYKSGRLQFITDIKTGVQESDIIFIAVGTPPDKDYRADLSAVKSIAIDIGKYINGYKIIVNKSTVPIGTGDLVKYLIFKENIRLKTIEYDVISNPEFLKEGTAIKDFTNPDRIVIGTDSEDVKKVMYELYKGIIRADKPILFTDVKSAEMIKYASNAMLATRISFMNELSKLCEVAGGDIRMVAKGMGLDNRIGPKFLQAGIGYGGSCFSKDIKALKLTMKECNINSKILQAIEDVNEEQRYSIISKVFDVLKYDSDSDNDNDNDNIKGKNIAIWGLAFKPKTDDIRDAPSLIIIEKLLKLGAKINAYDPVAMNNTKKVIPKNKNMLYSSTPCKALVNADCLILMTEWNEFRNIDKQNIKRLMKQPNIIDGRNVWDSVDMNNEGFNYIGIGKKVKFNTKYIG